MYLINRLFLTLLWLAVAPLLFAGLAFSEEPNIITFTQTPCQIVESESENKTYKSGSYNECKEISKSTASSRKLKTLKLKSGKTIFRVTNKNVQYPLGFWVRGTVLAQVMLPTVSGGGLETGKTLDYVIDLKPGEYYYSCPLNPTPDYTLLVE